MNDLMIDIETAGSRSGSAILTIAAVWFDAQAEPSDMPTQFSDGDPAILYERVELQSCLDNGLVVDAATLNWWMNQAPSAREEAFTHTSRVTLPWMVDRLIYHFTPGQRQCGRVWSHGASFDIPIVEAAIRAIPRNIPWEYWNIRDTRTLYEVAEIDRTKPALPHHAVFDAFAQIHDVQRAYRKLRDA